MRSFTGRDILSLKDFERDEYFGAFQVCEQLKHYARDRRNGDLLTEKTPVTAFYQPSTRTRLATEAAMHRLGGHVVGFSDAKMTRAGDFYQESIKDTVHMLEYYGDVIAMRHFQQGAPAEAAHWSSVPIINCGDGWGEHPTQVHEPGEPGGTRVVDDDARALAREVVRGSKRRLFHNHGPPASLDHPTHDSVPVVGLVIEDPAGDAPGLLFPWPHELGAMSRRVGKGLFDVPGRPDPIGHSVVGALQRVAALRLHRMPHRQGGGRS